MRCFATEFCRAFFSFKFLLGIIGVSFSQFMSAYKVTGVYTSVYITYVATLYFIPYIMSLMFCSISYADSICEDMENRYLQQILLRSNLKAYSILRVVMICLSAIMTMMLGTFIFAIIVRMKVPWVDVNDYFANDILARVFFENNDYILFFVVHSFFMGILAAFLSLLATYVSLFWRNRLFIMVMPLVTYYFFIYLSRELFKNIPQLDVRVMFNPSYNVWNNEIISIIWPIVIGIIIITILGICVYMKLRRMYDD